MHFCVFQIHSPNLESVMLTSGKAITHRLIYAGRSVTAAVTHARCCSLTGDWRVGVDSNLCSGMHPAACWDGCIQTIVSGYMYMCFLAMRNATVQ